MIRTTFAALMGIVMLGFVSNLDAATIVKLSLGGDAGSDVRFSGGTLSTINDGNILTTGDQDTNVEYDDFLAALADTTGSFSLSGLTPSGAPVTVGSVVVQSFSGGNLELYQSPTNLLLLSGTLSSSVLTGTTGVPGTGAVFTTSLGNFTGGTLQSQLINQSLTLSMALNDVRTGGVLGLSTAGGVLNPFEADASVLIGGTQIPEPTGILLLAMGAALTGLMRRRQSKK